MSTYPDGFYLWTYGHATAQVIEVIDNIAHPRMRGCSPGSSPESLVSLQDMTLTPLIPASPVIVEALTIYTILCGVDDNRIAAAELLDRVKALPRAR